MGGFLPDIYAAGSVELEWVVTVVCLCSLTMLAWGQKGPRATVDMGC